MFANKAIKSMQQNNVFFKIVLVEPQRYFAVRAIQNHCLKSVECSTVRYGKFTHSHKNLGHP